MRWSYFFKHWMTTVLLGSLLFVIFLHFYRSFFVLDVLFYMFLIFYSTILSFPTFTILAFVFNYLDRLEMDIKKKKAIFISVTTLGVLLTQLVIVRELILDVSVSYSVAALISGMVFRLKRKNKEFNE